jgi:hypothetical protein
MAASSLPLQTVFAGTRPRARLVDGAAFRRFVFAGRAVFTLVAAGQRFTYRVESFRSARHGLCVSLLRAAAVAAAAR